MLFSPQKPHLSSLLLCTFTIQSGPRGGTIQTCRHSTSTLGKSGWPRLIEVRLDHASFSHSCCQIRKSFGLFSRPEIVITFIGDVEMAGQRLLYAPVYAELPQLKKDTLRGKKKGGCYTADPKLVAGMAKNNFVVANFRWTNICHIMQAHMVKEYCFTFQEFSTRNLIWLFPLSFLHTDYI